MKTVEEMRTQAQELIHLAADYSRQATEALQKDREQGKALMRKAREAGQRFQVVISEIIRQQKLEE